MRVSLVCWGRDQAQGPMLDGVAVPAIHADLTAGAANLTTARRLPENVGVAFQGSKKVGPFEVPGSVAREWLQLPSNPNGRPNSDVLRPSWIGIDVARRARDEWIIDFTGLPQAEAAYFAPLYAHVVKHVKPLRDVNARETRRRNWWLHGDAQPRMRAAIKNLKRCIVTPEVSKHRVFAWLPKPVLPDCQLMVVARDDDTTFGILHSRFHEIWSLRLGTALEDRPRYTPSTTFETFPFPDGLSPDRPAATFAADPRAKAIAHAAQALVTARDRWLNPAELVECVPEVVGSYPNRTVPRNQGSAATLRTRTLTALYNTRNTPAGAWLDSLHRTLDNAVAAAYSWPSDLPDTDVLSRLLALNQARQFS